MNPLRSSGVTLIEMMVVVALAAILLALAAPSFTETVRRNRIESAANAFINALNFARTEAIRRGVSISVRRSGTEWEGGYFVFVDNDGDGTQDSGESTLRSWQALPGGYTLRTNSSNFTDFVRYDARGEVANNSAGGYFIVCFSGQLARAWAILVTRMRPVLAADLNGNGIPESDTGDIGSCTP